MSSSKQQDVAAIVAIVAVLGSGIGWILSVERRMVNRVTAENFYAEIKVNKNTLRGEMESLKNELNTDIRGLRERMNSLAMSTNKHP